MKGCQGHPCSIHSDCKDKDKAATCIAGWQGEGQKLGTASEVDIKIKSRLGERDRCRLQ